MNQTQNQNPDDESDLEAFDSPETDFDVTDEQLAAEAAQDAEFQDVGGEEIDADVFGEQQPQDQPAKKKTNWFNIGVAVIATAVAGGLIFMKAAPQLMGGNEPPPMMVSEGPAAPEGVSPQDAKSSSAAAAQAALGGPAGNTAPAAVGNMMDNPAGMAALNQAPVAVADNQPQGPVSDPFAALGSTPVSDPVMPVQAEGDVPMPAPISQNPNDVTAQPIAAPDATNDAALKAAMMPVNQPPAAAPVSEVAPAAMPVTTATSDDTAIKAQMNALESKVNSMEAKINAAVEQISQAASQMPVAGATPVDDTRLNTIQTTLERLEARLDDLSSSRRQAPVAVSADAGKPVKKTAKKAAKPKASSSPAPTKWDEPYTAPTEVTKPVQVSASSGGSGWELRGAQNGRAVIARGDDLREVGVGEVVPGLGEVTGVARMNGRWIVQGTEGRLSQ